MKITRRQLRKIIREATGIQGQDFFRYETDAAYAAAIDADGNGVPDDQEDTMDPDAKVTMILNKINDLLQDAHEIARNALLILSNSPSFLGPINLYTPPINNE